MSEGRTAAFMFTSARSTDAAQRKLKGLRGPILFIGATICSKVEDQTAASNRETESKRPQMRLSRTLPKTGRELLCRCERGACTGAEGGLEAWLQNLQPLRNACMAPDGARG